MVKIIFPPLHSMLSKVSYFTALAAYCWDDQKWIFPIFCFLFSSTVKGKCFHEICCVSFVWFLILVFVTRGSYRTCFR